jgi:hypothetical protein
MKQAKDERPPPRVLTLRFRNRRTYQRLKHIAGIVGSSMNEIAEAAVERELDFLSTDLEAQLSETVEALRSWRYSDDDLEQEIRKFGEGEGSVRDPMRSTMTSAAAIDALNIGDLFADSLEQ